MRHVILVIGSGPAGVSAAAALLASGHRVTMIDAGLQLEPERRDVVAAMASQTPARWPAESLATIKDKMVSGKSGIPIKYVYGSDFPYRETDKYLPRVAHEVGLAPSLARGGFSNVWGAAVLPYLREELAGWPFSYDELAPHYAAVLGLTGLAAADDDMSERFPLFHGDPRPLPRSRQASAFLADLETNRELLNSRGLVFGGSRLAVSATNPAGTACAACGLCMYGCPYGLIYSTNSTLDELRTHPAFRYRGGLVVDRFKEAGDGVLLDARSIEDGSKVSIEGDRVFVAAGVIASTKLLLESARALGKTLTIKDSQYFLLPLLRHHGTSGATRESLHTLAQVFIEIFDREVSEHSVHLQVYTYNDLYRQAVQAVAGPAFPVVRPGLDAFLNRFLIIQGYLHSDLSGTISVSLEQAAGGGTQLNLSGIRNPETKPALRRVARKLAASRGLLKASPMGPMLKVGEPGRGFHSGGTLPMREQPAEFETDKWGRPGGYERVHIVDSSVFPTITASTITLTVMANAHRIAAEFDRAAAPTAAGADV
jgi:choline dehydrogenase-like flavoprotein